MSDLIREEFEEWFLINAKWYGNRDCLEFDGEEYSDGSVQLAFDAWKASPECLVIELPKPRVARGYGEQVADALGFNDGINYCEEAIHAAGVKTK